MKKIITSLLIVFLLFNVFLPKSMVFAYNDTHGTTKKSTLEEIMTIDKNQLDEDLESGKSDVAGKTHEYKISEGTQNSVINFFVKAFNGVATIAKIIMDASVYDSNESSESAEYGNKFSIQKLVFNKIEIFNIDFFSDSFYDSDTTKELKVMTAQVFYTMRNITIIIMLIILIFTGIRMAISSAAEQKARYKQMLTAWAGAFVVLLLLPYIMVGILAISKLVMGLFEGILKGICGDEVILFEEKLLDNAGTSTAKGFSMIIPSILYLVITFYQIKFFWMYFKRIFSTAFLIVISPLVLAQHAFDKIGDGQAGAFKSWLTEFALNVAMQPIHAVVFSIFMVIAANIMESAPLLAVIFFAALSRTERVVRGLLSIKKTNTVQGLDENFKAKDAIDKVEDVGKFVGSL